ncbi:peptidase C14 [Elizabethkingia anophelis]|nr:peptidase C14 [Elizabethkingia anophelis]
MKALALVIGNNNYNLPEHRLINAINDATDFSNKLNTLGFVTILKTDCDLETFDRALLDFGEQLKNYDVALFYFSGHGLQIEGINYLTAIDTNFADAVSAKHRSIKLDEVIDHMQKAKPVVKILILDACRDNPLPTKFRGVNANGLAPIHAPTGTLIAFSTSPGEKALDYGSGKNSIYTGSLLNHIDDKNIPIEVFFKRVRTSVNTLSDGKQTSWEHTSLIGDFFFNSGQLIHSMQLPYKIEYIADENFQSDGSDFGSIIEGLRSHDYYVQKPAILKLTGMQPLSFNDSELFLVGRNILQVALGGEFTAVGIFDNLANWLQKYQKGTHNHVLNGILYEIYFNSKGLFRYKDFKNDLIDKIFTLQVDARYKSSFEFINLQLAPFKDFIFYMPTNPPVTLPIEVMFKKEKEIQWEQEVEVYRLVSVKSAGMELLAQDGLHINMYRTRDYDSFVDELWRGLTVPKANLRISTNYPKEELSKIKVPWNLKLKNNSVQ